ncbi:integral membrane protein [Cellulomonas flavigena DSM 20109]|uniref:Integral membrane protein n=1 Tax=Cellulomonas flavigena (strain ATCC 482 / DSM 20109 / BCRC 11376 / JCM 18109 / NBRC 3775 / NCIMB 8073 / NRS 134) TaxID=446466 RepID=D5UJU0_CELFN|nr:membrane protein [Cellulomonas flavigena]ADG75728.1 integral membrane protein [Cellulomonas flavigena DSM 20109]
MTTFAPEPRAAARAPRGAPARPGATLGRVLAAELTKLTSVPANGWLVLGTVAATAAAAYGLGIFVRPDDGRSGSWVVVSGFVLAQLGFVVLGALVGTAEHTTGTVRTTFAAVPRRLPVLAAQVVVTAAVAAVTAAAALGASWLATVPARAADAPDLDLAVPGAARTLVAFVAVGVAVALLGLGLGSLLRRPTDAIVTGVMLMFFLDAVLRANPGRFTDTVGALLPSAGRRLLEDDAAVAAMDAVTRGPELGVWGGGTVLGAWVAVLLGAAAYRLARHDVR